MEALAATGFRQDNGVSIDVGAAPGGWTSWLAASMQLVVAVDPAALDPAVAALPNVTHVRRTSHTAREAVLAVLAGQQVELITCDMNTHPRHVVPLLAPLLDLLQPGGRCVLTLNFVGCGMDKGEYEAQFQAALGPQFHSQVLWLMANTQVERTLVATRLATSQAATALPVHDG